MSQDSDAPETRTSKFVIPEEVWWFILRTLAQQILGLILKKLALGLKQLSAKVGRQVIWPFAIATLLGITLWLRTGVDTATLWNFPPYLHVPHLSLYAQPLLANFATTWSLSLYFSIVYCSTRYLKRFWWGEAVGELSRRLMLVALMSYAAIIAWFSLAAEISFLIPDWSQVLLWLGAAYPLSTILFKSVETIIGRKILGKGGLFWTTLNATAKVGSVGMRMIGENLYGNYRLLSSRVTGRTLELNPNPNIRPLLVALVTTLATSAMAISWKLGWTSMSQLSYAVGTPLYILVAASLILGFWKIRKDREAEKAIVRVEKSDRSRFENFSEMGAAIKRPLLRLFSLLQGLLSTL